MPRFFVAGSSIGNGFAVVTGDDANHIKVLRMRVGDKIILCDGMGNDHHCRILDIKNGQVETEITRTERNLAEPSIKTCILAGLPKGDRADLIVQKCTEIGALEIVFYISDRCVARPDEKSAQKKAVRYMKIAEEAAKQSGRGVIPAVGIVGSFAEALDIAVKKDLRLFMYETGDRIPMKDALKNASDSKSAAIITGPEGGFEPFEAELASKVGLTLCSMGTRILRCETAPAVALSALMYETGNMD